MENALQSALAAVGYKEIRDIQRQVVDAYVAGHDVLLVAPTGSGKSLTFEVAPYILGNLHQRDIVIVVSPLVALMKSQTRDLQRRGIPAMYFNTEVEVIK